MKLTAAACATPRLATAATPFRLGLTPVFLDNDALVIDRLRVALSTALDTSIELVQRRTYQEVTGLLLEGSVDAAWLCGYPFLQHRSMLSLIGVPVWRGRPRYQSYLIAAANDDADSLIDLAGGTHAFADPDSNSGWLVTASDLARMQERPETFFSRTVFTYGHRNVVRAVASGLTRSGSVDGYVWETLSDVEPDLTKNTRIVARSEWFGFPPFVARAADREDPRVVGFTRVLLNLPKTPVGLEALQLLHLDDIATGSVALFDGIAARMRVLGTDR